MKKMLKVQLLFIVGIILSFGEVGWGQCPSTQDEMIKYMQEFANKYEVVDELSPDYCKVWTAYTPSNGVIRVGSPFLNAKDPKLDVINQQEDYKKANGWEVMAVNLGANGIVAHPYFVLYNKYRALLRLFIWFNNTNNHQQYVVTMSHTTGGSKPAVLGHANHLVKAPDKYLDAVNDQEINNESISYVTSKTNSNRHWVVAEYRMMYDPNISNNKYNGASLQFAVHGVTTSNVKAKISGENITEEYSITGNKSEIQKPKKVDSKDIIEFAASGKKFLKNVTDLDADKLAKEVNDFITDKDKLYPPLPTSGGLGPLLSYGTQLAINLLDNKERENKFAKLFGSVQKIAGGASKFLGAIGVVGQVIGFLAPKKEGAAAKPPFTPTITKVNETLTGTIETSLPLDNIIVRLPGTQQGSGGNETYFTCPLGIFNLKNTPKADMVAYSNYIGLKEFYDYYDDYGEYEPRHLSTKSYKITNDVLAEYNKKAGLDLVSAQIAFIAEFNHASMLSKHVERNNEYRFNPFLFRVQRGQYRIAYYNPDTNPNNDDNPNNDIAPPAGQPIDKQKRPFVQVQTPYVNVDCFKGMTFNVSHGGKVYIRVKAVLKRSDGGNDAPILFIKDYALDVNDITADFNLSKYRQWIHHVPPFANQSATINDRFKMYDSRLSWARLNKANVSITYDGRNPVNASKSYEVEAGVEVTLKPGFKVPLGAEFNAKITDFGYALPDCGDPGQITAFDNSLDCYNLNATARTTEAQVATPAKELGNQLFDAYPNPTNGQVTIDYQVGTNGGKVYMYLSDVNARMVKILVASQVNNQGQHQVTFDTSELKPGMYFYTLQVDNYSKVKRLLVVK
ncbi:T9SS type A sorting domain-containing protein [Microscilla marina]|uniref:Secretion system C-terminal sorting domain-containing protein n=1 Tax=Microscilla marina ATCC 23134 TaxID=313606 RepID=A1ZQT1_MICM2|nr:T9SS type A sorting domain-containing protein [Microscilla marina]EAY27236.1 hypothetical protein M23134_06546 [Microscilla marina ATCC 23134]